MANKKLKRQLLLKKLYNKRRLVILNEDTFEETFSLKLNLMNVFVVGTIGAILIIFVTTYIIAFTPLREYIPGYASTKLKQDALEMAIKSDSLEKSVKIIYYGRFQCMILGSNAFSMHFPFNNFVIPTLKTH